MKSSFMHTKDDNKRTLIRYCICLIPLVLYGIYKNGYLLYQKNLINFFDIFKPIYLIIISLIINGIVEFIFNKKIKLDFSYLNVAILSLFVMPNVNIIIYVIVLLICLFLGKLLAKKIQFNQIAFIKLVLVGTVLLISNYTYSNIAEASNIYAYSLLDIICGRNTGGIAATNILLGVIIYSILANFTNYKKSIPIFSYITYLVVSAIYMVVIRDINYSVFFSSTVILGFIFVGTDTLSSPYTQKGMFIYSILLGVITAILSIWLPYEGVFISILVLSLINSVFDRNLKLKLKK